MALQAAELLALRREASHARMLHKLLLQDYQDLEFVLKETEKQRREYAARYAFMMLDGDNDGFIAVEQVRQGSGECSRCPEGVSSLQQCHFCKPNPYG